jgi:hypothetical protein
MPRLPRFFACLLRFFSVAGQIRVFLIAFSNMNTLIVSMLARELGERFASRENKQA